ncbi:MAG TPA: sugar phosphate nucleotidyltransferase [Terriglobia bacterium]|nr:sugar phosphate nucleotidyltransferase [Terriglobia bacterium]
MQNSSTAVPVFILAGGVGERLAPLTEFRPKPVLSFGGTHQVLDFTVSNCINSGLRNIYVLTQYRRDHLNDYIRAARLKLAQTFGSHSGQLVPVPPACGRTYRGTSDAVLQNLSLIRSNPGQHVLITAGDHIYSMDYRPLISHHVASGAKMTMAAVRRPASEASAFGVLEADGDRVTRFIEKPSRDVLPADGNVLVSMGIYIFRKDCLVDLARRSALSETDFGHHVVPRLVRRKDVAIYDFSSCAPSYWRDVGTLDSYFSANMDLLGPRASFDLDMNLAWPIVALNDPGTVNTAGSRISRRALVGPSVIRHSIISHGSCIDSGAVVENSIIMPGARVGRGAVVRNAMVTEGVRIADGAEVGVNSGMDRRRFAVTPGGIVVVNTSLRRIAEPRRSFTKAAAAA